MPLRQAGRRARGASGSIFPFAFPAFSAVILSELPGG
jgi:hypothetical protein